MTITCLMIIMTTMQWWTVTMTKIIVEKKTVDGIFFSLWTLMLQTDIIFRLQGLLFPHYIFQIKQCFQKGKK